MTDCTTDSNGCVDCPAVSGSPAIAQTTTVIVSIGWNAGARSFEAIDGDLHLVFTAGSVVGAVCGLCQDGTPTPIPALVQFGFNFQQASGGDYFSIVEYGATVFSLTLRSGLSDNFEVRRQGRAVTYWLNDTLLYTSAGFSAGPMIVSGCLFVSLDSIADSIVFEAFTAPSYGDSAIIGVVASCEGSDVANYGIVSGAAAATHGTGSSQINNVHGVLASCAAYDVLNVGSANALVAEVSASAYAAPPFAFGIDGGAIASVSGSGYMTILGTATVAGAKASVFSTNVSSLGIVSAAAARVSATDVDPFAGAFIIAFQSPGFSYIVGDDPILFGGFGDTLIGDDDPVAGILVTLVAALRGNATAAAVASWKMLLSDKAKALDKLNQAWHGALASALTASATPTRLYAAMANLFATLAAKGTPVPRADQHVMVAVTMLARDLINGFDAKSISETLHAHDTLTKMYSAYAAIAANLIASAVPTRSVGFNAIVSASAHVYDAIANTASYLASLIDTGQVFARLRTANGNYEGWVANVKPQGDQQIRAVTSYDNYPFNSFVDTSKIWPGGKAYGVSKDGFYLLEGETDNGAPIDGWVRTGLMDFGIRRLKRLEAVYLGFVSKQKMVLKVESTSPDGKTVEYWYSMEARPNATAITEGRIEPGKGLRSMYFEFEIHNSQGADFGLDTITWWPIVTDRGVSHG